jgi:hypothetical protein
MTTTRTTASAKDEYIREKKRIAVRLDEKAMAREVSDAVDLSLQKWKATLKELQEMEAQGIPTGHPIVTATKATADLHETAFNTYLARAKAQQDELLAPRELLLVRDTAILPAADDEDEEDNNARCPLVTEYRTPPSRTTSLLDISNSSTSFRSSNDNVEDNE